MAPSPGQAAAILLVGSWVTYQLMKSHLCLGQFELAFLTTKRDLINTRNFKEVLADGKRKGSAQISSCFLSPPAMQEEPAPLRASTTPLHTQLSHTTVLLASCPRRSAELLQGRGCVLFTVGP